MLGRIVHRCVTVLMACLLLSGAALAADEGDEQLLGPKSIYLNIQPPIVTNYGGKGRLRYLRAEVSLRVDSSTENEVLHHLPYIRHKLVMLLGRQSEDRLATMEGKELIRHEALEAVREVLLAEVGEQQVQDVLFSSFVIQR